jgi:hypothetical protein
MKKKMKKFADGGFTPAQEEWLGGADRTDPFILARMRAAVPDSVASDVAAPSRDFDIEDAVAPKAIEKTVVKTKVSPSKKTAEKTVVQEEKKPYIDIPKDTAIGLRQFRSDGVSPVERLIKSLTGSKSQRTMAAEKGMKKGGSVKVSSASKRADGCCVKGKTKGRMV